jgi:hypothetical protein
VIALATTIGLYDALKAEGFLLPEECVDVQLLTPICDVMQLRYVVNVTGADLEKIGRALTRLARAQRGEKGVTS